ncbi:MAG: glycosyltransferase [Candidatus Omnitrophota bacterium]
MMTNTYTPIVGGVEKSIESLTNTFRKKGHSVLIAAPTFEGMPEDEEGIVRVAAIRKFNGSDFSIQLPISIELSKALNEFQPDVVHSHHPFLIGDTALRVANNFQIPLVFTHHTKYEDYTHYVPLDSPIMKRFVIELSTGYANLAHHVIAPSRSIYELLVKRGVQTPIDVIPTGIDLTRFSTGHREAFRSRWKIPEDAFVIGHVGRLAPEKNIPFLLQAVILAMKKNKQAWFLLVGKGSSLDEILRAFQREGLDSRLCATGTLFGEELVNAYHAMNIFAFASTTETQGMVLAEAVAAGTPVVAIDADGVREVVQDCVNGRMIRSADLAEFTAALEWMMERPANVIQDMKKECLVTSRAFDLDKLAQQILSLYEDLIDQDLVYTETDVSVWSNAAARLRTEWNLIKNITQSAGTALNPEKNQSKPGTEEKARTNWGRGVRQWLGKQDWSLKRQKRKIRK